MEGPELPSTARQCLLCCVVPQGRPGGTVLRCRSDASGVTDWRAPPRAISTGRNWRIVPGRVLAESTAALHGRECAVVGLPVSLRLCTVGCRRLPRVRLRRSLLKPRTPGQPWKLNRLRQGIRRLTMPYDDVFDFMKPTFFLHNGQFVPCSWDHVASRVGVRPYREVAWGSMRDHCA